MKIDIFFKNFHLNQRYQELNIIIQSIVTIVRLIFSLLSNDIQKEVNENTKIKNKTSFWYSKNEI